VTKKICEFNQTPSRPASLLTQHKHYQQLLRSAFFKYSKFPGVSRILIRMLATVKANDYQLQSLPQVAFQYDIGTVETLQLCTDVATMGERLKISY
jgi:hypothetical protein